MDLVFSPSGMSVGLKKPPFARRRVPRGDTTPRYPPPPPRPIRRPERHRHRLRLAVGHAPVEAVAPVLPVPGDVELRGQHLRPPSSTLTWICGVRPGIADRLDGAERITAVRAGDVVAEALEGRVEGDGLPVTRMHVLAFMSHCQISTRSPSSGRPPRPSTRPLSVITSPPASRTAPAIFTRSLSTSRRRMAGGVEGALGGGGGQGGGGQRFR